MSSAIRSLRFLPIGDSKDRQRYSDGEVFYDRQLKTLRIYDGVNRGGVTLATEDYVDTAIDSIPTVDLTGYATLNSPTFTGNTTATRIVLGGPNYGDYGQLQFRWNGSETDQAYIYNQNQSLVFWRDGTSYMSLSGSGLSVTGGLNINGINGGLFVDSQGITTMSSSNEILSTKTSATGTVDHDFTTGAIWYHSNIASNFAANFTNIPATNDRTTAVVLVLAQDATAYIPDAVQIDGVAQTIKWLGGSAPSGTANKTDIVSFTLIRTSDTWTVLGSLSTYG